MAPTSALGLCAIRRQSQWATKSQNKIFNLDIQELSSPSNDTKTESQSGFSICRARWLYFYIGLRPRFETMNRLTARVLLLSLLLVSSIAVFPITSSAQSNSLTSNKIYGCFVFTENGKNVSTPYCNTKADGISIAFSPSSFIQFYASNGQPDGSSQGSGVTTNGVTVNWGSTISRCYWTINGTTTGLPCTVPKKPKATEFVLDATAVKYVSWIRNGVAVSTIEAPAGTNGVQPFYLS